MFSTKKTALLVGSSGALGPIWHQTLIKLGYLVNTADFSDPDCDYRLDLRSDESVSRLIYDCTTDIDCLVINAGMDSKPLEAHGSNSGLDFFRKEWSDFFETNVLGPAQLIEGLIPKLRPGAKVISIGSMYALVAPRQDVYNSEGQQPVFLKHPAYGASKAALLNLMKSYATRFAGTFDFNLLTLGVVTGDQSSHFKKTMPQNLPTGEFLSRTELGTHLAYLLEAPRGQLVAHNLVVDGGYTAW